MIGGNHGIFKSRLGGIEVDLLNDNIDDTGFIDKHYFDGSYNGQYLYELTVCCKTGDPYTLEIMVPAILAEPYAGSVYRYIAPTTYTGPNGNVLRQYDCGSITQIFTPSGADPASISNVAFELVTQAEGECKACCSAEALFERRCDGAQIRLNISNSDFTVYTDPEKFYKYVGLVVLIDENGTPVYTNDFLRLISKSTAPSTSADSLDISSTEEWTCSEFDNDCGICETYYKIVSCDASITEEYCTDQDLSAYVGSGPIKVIINNEPSDICWTVEEATTCEFLTTITVSEEFTTCEECLTPLNYRLESCADDDSTVIYTSTDLSQYVGMTVNLEGYGNCFFVEIFQERVPSVVQVSVTNSYSNCIECPKPRYQLTNCQDPTDLIVTTVNLEAQIGSVIKISFYPEKCWTVSVTEDNTSDDPIILTDVFTTCEECLPVLTCDCTIVKNTSSVAADFQYVDCDDVTNTITLQPGQSTPKICAKEWIFPDGWTDTTCLQNFGECVDNVCPPPAIPFRKIKPGYNTPGCTIEYYERVTCKFADLMYNEVMSKRYGIEPCCPEDEFYKTHIKEQLLEMKAITDPQPCSTVPQVLYSCVDGVCVEDVNGTYLSMAECQSNCSASNISCPQVQMISGNIYQTGYTFKMPIDYGNPYQTPSDNLLENYVIADEAIDTDYRFKRSVYEQFQEETITAGNSGLVTDFSSASCQPDTIGKLGTTLMYADIPDTQCSTKSFGLPFEAYFLLPVDFESDLPATGVEGQRIRILDDSSERYWNINTQMWEDPTISAWFVTIDGISYDMEDIFTQIRGCKNAKEGGLNVLMLSTWGLTWANKHLPSFQINKYK